MLTDTQIRNARPKVKPYKLSDSGGLYVDIRPNGSKLWRYRYRIDGKENLFALGEYAQPDARETEEQADCRRQGRAFTLLEARAEREDARKLVRQGMHPSQHRRTAKLQRSTEAASTFEAVARAWMTEGAKHWSENYRRQVDQRLGADAFPHIGALPIKLVSPAHVKDVIKRIEKRGSPASAKLVKTWIGGVFRYAAGELLVETDPTWPLRNSIRAPATRHHPHLTAKEIPAFLRALEGVQAEHTTMAAAKLLWLTVVRTVELRGAEWSEFDLDDATWLIPGERMKMRKPHTVPLSRQAVELLKALQPITGRGRYVLPGRKSREQPLTHEGIRDLFNRGGYAGKFSPHGVRGTFSTFFNEAGTEPELIELTLAHKDPDYVRGAYNHAKRLEARRDLLQQWADLTDAWRQGAKVLPIKKTAA